MAYRIFEGVAHAESYFKFRPSYPADLFQKILSFLREKVRESEKQQKTKCRKAESNGIKICLCGMINGNLGYSCLGPVF